MVPQSAGIGSAITASVYAFGGHVLPHWVAGWKESKLDAEEVEDYVVGCIAGYWTFDVADAEWDGVVLVFIDMYCVDAGRNIGEGHTD